MERLGGGALRLDDTFMSAATRGQEQQLILREYGKNLDILIENVKIRRKNKARLEYSAASNLLFHFKFNWLLTFCQ